MPDRANASGSVDVTPGEATVAAPYWVGVSRPRSRLAGRLPIGSTPTTSARICHRPLERRLLDLFQENRISGTTHTCRGREADALGSCQIRPAITTGMGATVRFGTRSGEGRLVGTRSGEGRLVHNNAAASTTVSARTGMLGDGRRGDLAV